jgi:hypothetical protein
MLPPSATICTGLRRARPKKHASRELLRAPRTPRAAMLALSHGPSVASAVDILSVRVVPRRCAVARVASGVG